MNRTRWITSYYANNHLHSTDPLVSFPVIVVATNNAQDQQDSGNPPFSYIATRHFVALQILYLVIFQHR